MDMSVFWGSYTFWPPVQLLASLLLSACCMADRTNDGGMNPDISDGGDSDDEVSLLVVDEDELNTSLSEAGIKVRPIQKEGTALFSVLHAPISSR